MVKLSLARYSTTACGIALTAASGFYLYKYYKFPNRPKRIKDKRFNFTMVQLEDGFKIPSDMFSEIPHVRKFLASDKDVIVASFPKSGTTWLQEIVYLLLTDLDFESASKENMESRFPYLEYVWPGVQSIQMSSPPRMIKTHLPYSYLPDSVKSGSARIIYILRDPKDVVVSYYHFSRMFTQSNFQGKLSEFVDLFCENVLPYCPWSQHVKTYTDAVKNSKNILIICYEDLHTKPYETISKIGNFLGKQYKHSDLKSIIEHCSFDNMKTNPSTNYKWWDQYGLRNKGESDFFRKGKIGDHINNLNQNQIKKIDSFLTDDVKSYLEL